MDGLRHLVDLVAAEKQHVTEALRAAVPPDLDPEALAAGRARAMGRRTLPAAPNSKIFASVWQEIAKNVQLGTVQRLESQMEKA